MTLKMYNSGRQAADRDLINYEFEHQQGKYNESNIKRDRFRRFEADH